MLAKAQGVYASGLHTELFPPNDRIYIYLQLFKDRVIIFFTSKDNNKTLVNLHNIL
jgi:hypothetical protein